MGAGGHMGAGHSLARTPPRLTGQQRMQGDGLPSHWWLPSWHGESSYRYVW